MNWDTNPETQIYYHGEDIRFTVDQPYDELRDLSFYVRSLYDYDIFHFSNAYGICFGSYLQRVFANRYHFGAEVELLKQLGKVIAYTNNGCLDGVSQTAFSKWGPIKVCDDCVWQDKPEVCSDGKNLAWGKTRNAFADYQVLLGGNRVDYNLTEKAHERPEFYCLDPDFWSPDLEIPEQWRIPRSSPDEILVYHAVGHREVRSDATGRNVKSTHIYLPLIDRLRSEGRRIRIINPTGVPNRDVRYLQAQADIVLEMLTFGWFGANAREAMMLGKPVICFIRPEWLDSLRRELPEYASDLPIVSALPTTIESVLTGLMDDPERRAEIGRRSAQFARRWHSKQAGAQCFDEVYQKLLRNEWGAGLK